MSKYQAHIIVYSWKDSIGYNVPLKKLQKFLHRERFQIDREKFDSKQYNFAFSDDILRNLEPFEELDNLSVPAPVEFSYSFCIYYNDLKKIHQTLSLIQSYTSYIGIYYRLLSLKLVE